MKIQNTVSLFLLAMIFTLSGCVVRSYEITKDRPDQNLTEGNRGYLAGEAPAPAQRKTTRTRKVVEVELRPIVKFEKTPESGKSGKKAIPEPLFKEGDRTASWGNQGYTTRSEPIEIIKAEEAGIQKYTVAKGDTLQKISEKFYGTTKKWPVIFQANKDRLKGPDKIRAGQVLDIPLQPLGEPAGKIK